MLNQQELLDKVKVYNNYIDENVVKKAYNFAFDVHKNQKSAQNARKWPKNDRKCPKNARKWRFWE